MHTECDIHSLVISIKDTSHQAGRTRGPGGLSYTQRTERSLVRAPQHYFRARLPDDNGRTSAQILNLARLWRASTKASWLLSGIAGNCGRPANSQYWRSSRVKRGMVRGNPAISPQS